MKTILIGHRGVMELRPENTLSSFQEALRYPYISMVELDVHRIPSGELVVIHDNKLDRTTNGKGYVMNKSFSYLRSLDAGDGEKIPTLEEVLDLIDKKVVVNIEIKGSGTAQGVAETLERYIENGWKIQNFIVSSFYPTELKKIKELMPDINIGIILDKSHKGYVKLAEKMEVFSIHPKVELVTKKFLDDAHKHGFKVFAWMLKNPEKIRKMERLGVDGIFVNNPEFAFKILQES
ncbi:MAG: glycerophosphodiester phosphodiesterase family protein [Patescibacteria group bacterium]